MIRKLVLASGAIAVIGAAALSPTAASASGWHGYRGPHGWYGGWHRGFGISFAAPAYYGDCYIVRRVVWTPYGKRIRRVRVCD